MSARGAHVFSLRTKLVVFAAALVVIPGAIYGAITVSRSREAMARVVGRQFVEGARNAADQLATMLRSEQERIHWLAAQDVMREIRIGDFDKRISLLLASAKKSCLACVDLFVVDEQHRVVASSNPAWIGRTEDDPPARDRARETIEGPLRTESGGRPILRLTVPVPDLEAPESQLGWLAALLDWERASEAISRVRKRLLSGGLDGEVLIVDASGRVIGGAGRSGGPWQPGDSLDPRLLEADDRASASHIDSAAGMLFGTARLPDTLPPWRVVVAQPLAEALAPVYRVEWARANDATELSLNFAAFRKLMEAGPDLTRTERILAWFIRHLSFNVQVESLVKFNSKFHPRWVPRYLVYRSAADLPAILTAILSAEGYLPFDRKRAAEEPAVQFDPAVSGAVL